MNPAPNTFLRQMSIVADGNDNGARDRLSVLFCGAISLFCTRRTGLYYILNYFTQNVRENYPLRGLISSNNLFYIRTTHTSSATNIHRFLVDWLINCFFAIPSATYIFLILWNFYRLNSSSPQWSQCACCGNETSVGLVSNPMAEGNTDLQFRDKCVWLMK